MRKHMLTIVLLLLLSLCLVMVMTASAEAAGSGSCGNDANWTLDDNGTLTISGTGAMDNFKKWSSPWDNSKVRSVRVEDGITSVGDYAFSWCDQLTEVKLSDSVTRLGKGAFTDCSCLPSIQIPDSVTEIGEEAFSSCVRLTSIRIPDGVTEISRDAFSYCDSLTEVKLGSGVTRLGDSAFDSCINLPSIQIPDSVEEIGDSAFNYCKNLTEVKLGSSVARLGHSVFATCEKLPSIRIPANVTEIGDWAFEGCDALREIIVDQENPAFASEDGVLFNRDKTRLLVYLAGKPDEAYVIPDTVTELASRAFYGAGNLRTVTFPGSVKTAGFGYYEGLTSLETVILLDGVEAIGDEAFAGCEALKEVRFPETLRSVGYSAFQGTAVERVILPDSVEELVDHAFYDSGIQEVRIPSKVTALPEAAFYCCPELEIVTIPGSVKEIGERAFSECGALKTVVLEEGVETIAADAFDQCGSLAAVNYGGTKESWRSIRNLSVELLRAAVYDKNGQEIPPEFPDLTDFGVCGKDMVWYYCSDGTLTIRGSGSMDDYMYSNSYSFDSSGTRYDTSSFTYPWNQYGNEIQTVIVEEGVSKIGNMALAQIKTLKTAYLPASLHRVADGAFHGSGLTDVYYAGTQTQWTGVAKGLYNEPLLSASLHDWVLVPEPETPLMELKSRDGLRFTLSLNLTEDAELYVAWYDQNGRFLGCTMEPVGPGNPEFVCDSVRDGAKTGKVLLTDQDLRPLCPGIPVSD